MGRAVVSPSWRGGALSGLSAWPSLAAPTLVRLGDAGRACERARRVRILARRHSDARVWARVVPPPLGFPPTGKSTLLNQIVGYERVLTGPLPGVTRDATEVDVTTPDGVALRLVDTAGVLAHRRAGASTPDETAPAPQLLRAGTMRAVERADVAVLVVDCPANSGSGARQVSALPPPGPGRTAAPAGEGRRPARAASVDGRREDASGDGSPARALGGERGGLLSHEQGLLR